MLALFIFIALVTLYPTGITGKKSEKRQGNIISTGILKISTHSA